MKLPPQITWLQYALANAAIVVLIPFLALQGMPPIDWAWSWASRPVRAKEAEPSEEQEALLDEQQSAQEEAPPEDEESPPLPTPVADWLATKITPVANLTGVSNAPWKMFAPKPDANNHRLRAKIEYLDGTVVLWRSPEWPELSCWKRFWTSRELEYIDNIAYNSPPERRFAFADYLAAQNRQNSLPEGGPKRVTFVKEEAFITNPNISGWVPMSQPIPRREEEIISPKRVYPVPLELLKKQIVAPARQPPP